MTGGREFAERSLEALARRGFAKAQVRVTQQDRHELEGQFGHPSMLRTTHNATATLTGLVDDKRGSVTLNRLADDALDDAVAELWEVTIGSKPDPANDVAPAQPAQTFDRGTENPDYERMYDRLAELLDYAQTHYPTLMLRQSNVDFTAGTDLLLNSNGVDYTARGGRYNAMLMFSAKEGAKVSSFNSTHFVRAALDEPLHRCGTADALMRQSTQQVHTRKVPQKFTGELIMTPDCLMSFVGFLLERVGDAPMIGGTSLYHGKLGTQVVAPALTVHSQPRSLPAGYFVTDDGFEARDSTIVERGVLRSYLLGLYGARKTGFARADTGGCWVIEPGADRLDDMVRGVDRGIMITRFSGGRPNEKGDFSGIAKNSYYIENGQVQFPVSETMISGNLAELLRNVTHVSAERADFGHGILPWVRASGVGVS
jgi:PmbA protein